MRTRNEIMSDALISHKDKEFFCLMIEVLLDIRENTSKINKKVQEEKNSRGKKMKKNDFTQKEIENGEPEMQKEEFELVMDPMDKPKGK